MTVYDDFRACPIDIEQLADGVAVHAEKGHDMTLDVTVVALDVGGTRLKGAVLDGSGRALVTTEAPTPTDDGPGAVIEAILDALSDLQSRPPARSAGACGIVVPGIVDSARGNAVRSENLRWQDVPLRELAEERTGLPTVLGHDVRAGGLAEARYGAAAGLDDVLFMPIGTGIAAAAIVDGHLLDGGGFAGELGHVDVGHAELCACGATGCLEAVASAAAIARRFGERTGMAVAGAPDVLERAKAGDPDARTVWADALDALSRGLAAACSLVAPEVVVLGGGLSLAGADLIEPLAARLDARLTFQRRPRLVSAALGDRAGCLGAGLLAQSLTTPGPAAKRSAS